MPAKKTAAKSDAGTSQKARLLGAALRLAATGIPASRLDAKAVAAEAKLKPAQFAAAFPQREDFLLDLLKSLSEEVRMESVKAIAMRPPGRSLIREGIVAYLDIILNRPALLEITSTLRLHPVCEKITRNRMASLVMLATLQLKMAEVSNAEGIGQLGMAMLFEITHAEYEARRPLADYRHTIDSFFVSD
jgi:hypothetical protein